MKDYLINNAGNIGGILFIIVHMFLFHLCKEYNYTGKWVDLYIFIVGFLICVGAFVLGKNIVEFLMK